MSSMSFDFLRSPYDSPLPNLFLNCNQVPPSLSPALFSRLNYLAFAAHLSPSPPSCSLPMTAAAAAASPSPLAGGCRPDPSAVIARQLGLKLHRLGHECPLLDGETGRPVPKDLDDRIMELFDSLLDETAAFTKGESLGDGLSAALKKYISSGWALSSLPLPVPPPCLLLLAWAVDFGFVCGLMCQLPSGKADLGESGERILAWHFANLEYGCSARLSEVSLEHWNQDDTYGGFGGGHAMVKGGYSQVCRWWEIAGR